MNVLTLVLFLSITSPAWWCIGCAINGSEIRDNGFLNAIPLDELQGRDVPRTNYQDMCLANRGGDFDLQLEKERYVDLAAISDGLQMSYSFSYSPPREVTSSTEDASLHFPWPEPQYESYTVAWLFGSFTLHDPSDETLGGLQKLLEGWQGAHLSGVLVWTKRHDHWESGLLGLRIEHDPDANPPYTFCDVYGATCKSPSPLRNKVLPKLLADGTLTLPEIQFSTLELIFAPALEGTLGFELTALELIDQKGDRFCVRVSDR